MRLTIMPIFDIHHSEVTQHESPSDQFSNIQRDDDAMRWMGRGSIMELPEDGSHGGPHGAGGNADGSGDPIDFVHEKAKKSFHIAGPKDVTGCGNVPYRKGDK
jgi:hypothetical protein